MDSLINLPSLRAAFFAARQSPEVGSQAEKIAALEHRMLTHSSWVPHPYRIGATSPSGSRHLAMTTYLI